MTIFPGYPVTIDGETAQIGTAAELVVALDVLQGQHDRQVLAQLAPHLAEIIAQPEGLTNTFRVLVPDDRLYLIEALGPRLAGLVQSASALRDILAMLAETAVEEALLKAIGGDALRNLLATPEEAADVFEWIYGDCDRLLLELLGVDHLRTLFQSGYDLSLLLHALEAPAQELLLARLTWERVVALVRDRRDLAHLLRALPPQMSERLLAHFSPEQLRPLVGNERGWRYLQGYLQPEELAYLTDLLGRPDHAQ